MKGVIGIRGNIDADLWRFLKRIFVDEKLYPNQAVTFIAFSIAISIIEIFTVVSLSVLDTQSFGTYQAVHSAAIHYFIFIPWANILIWDGSLMDILSFGLYLTSNLILALIVYTLLSLFIQVAISYYYETKETL